MQLKINAFLMLVVHKRCLNIVTNNFDYLTQLGNHKIMTQPNFGSKNRQTVAALRERKSDILLV